MTYFDNVQEVCIQANRVAWAHRNPKAWDNKKIKTCKRQLPRGKVYKRLLQLQGHQMFNQALSVHMTALQRSNLNNDIN